jgi:IclR family transcriptional regulator, acetate operon repressor
VELNHGDDDRARSARPGHLPAASGQPSGEGRQATASRSIASVERAMDVLMLFASHLGPDLGVTEIGHELGLPKAAVHRILAALRSRNLIVVDETTRRYSLGPSVLSLGLAYRDRLDIRREAQPELAWLSAESKETATLSVRVGDERMYVDQVLPDREVRMEVTPGIRYPLHAGASSKAFLAFLPETERERYLTGSPLPSLTGRTVTDPAALRKEIAAIRQTGYATSDGERQVGAAAAAAPVFDHAGQPAAVISVSGPRERFLDELPECSLLLLQATARVSTRMGYRAS